MKAQIIRMKEDLAEKLKIAKDKRIAKRLAALEKRATIKKDAMKEEVIRKIHIAAKQSELGVRDHGQRSYYTN